MCKDIQNSVNISIDALIHVTSTGVAFNKYLRETVKIQKHWDEACKYFIFNFVM